MVTNRADGLASLNRWQVDVLDLQMVEYLMPTMAANLFASISCRLSNAGRTVCKVLRLNAEFGGFEGVLLGHRLFRAIQTIPHEFTKEREAHLAGAGNAMLPLGIDKEQLVPAVVAGDVGIFAEFDVTFGAEDQKTAVTPCAKALGGEPVDSEIAMGIIVS